LGKIQYVIVGKNLDVLSGYFQHVYVSDISTWTNHIHEYIDRRTHEKGKKPTQHIQEQLAYNRIIHAGQILNIPSFGHDIVQQVIKGCKEICGKNCQEVILRQQCVCSW